MLVDIMLLYDSFYFRERCFYEKSFRFELWSYMISPFNKAAWPTKSFLLILVLNVGLREKLTTPFLPTFIPLIVRMRNMMYEMINGGSTIVLYNLKKLWYKTNIGLRMEKRSTWSEFHVYMFHVTHFESDQNESL